jgi:hypothetical protein
MKIELTADCNDLPTMSSFWARARRWMPSSTWSGLIGQGGARPWRSSPGASIAG